MEGQVQLFFTHGEIQVLESAVKVLLNGFNYDKRFKKLDDQEIDVLRRQILCCNELLKILELYV